MRAESVTEKMFVTAFTDIDHLSLGCDTLQNYNKDHILMSDDTNSSVISPQILRFGKLSGDISNATFRMKKDKIIITLTKVDAGKVWHTINDKGTPDHEVV